MKNIMKAVDGQGLANNYDRQIQRHTNFRSTFVMQKKIIDNKFCDVTLASVNGQKFKAHKVILSASSIFFRKHLVNNLNHHPLIENESHMFTLKKLKLKETRWNAL